MTNEDQARVNRLCEQIQREQDDAAFLAHVRELNQLLEEHERVAPATEPRTSAGSWQRNRIKARM